MKKCFKCGKLKPLTDFYRHPRMGDGHLGKCKVCTKRDVHRDYDKNIQDPEWAEKERTRGRVKYRKYRYKSKASKKQETMNKYYDKYPEKRQSKNSKMTHSFDGSVFHHWSYRPEDKKDVIEIVNCAAHAKAHRFLIYDQERMMYRTLSGILLDSREAHVNYIADKIKTQPD